MTELRRLKMKIGEAEFEADVLENEVGPMYCQFLSMLERRHQMPVGLRGAGSREDPVNGSLARPDLRQPANGATTHAMSAGELHSEALDQAALTRVFDLRKDGAVILKVLPTGPDTNADAMLLILYGYYRLKNESYVLATQLFRAAEHSGIRLHRLAAEYVRNSRFVIRGGQRKGSHYSLSSQGLAFAAEITARMIG